MQAKVRKSGEDYIVTLPPQVVAELELIDGSAVEVRKVNGSIGAPALEIRRLSDEEARDLFGKIEPLHRDTFRELAK